MSACDTPKPSSPVEVPVDLRRHVERALERSLDELTLEDVPRLLAITPGLATLRLADLLANRWDPCAEGETLTSALLAPQPAARPLPPVPETEAAILAALRQSPIPLTFGQIGRRVGTARGLKVNLDRLIETQEIVRLHGATNLYTLAERKTGARARVRQAIKDTKFQLKRLRQSLVEAPPPEVIRFGTTLEGREAEIFHERTLAHKPVKIKEFSARWRVTHQRTREIENAMLLRLRLFLLPPDADANLGTPPVQYSVLNMLSLRRLRELAEAADLDIGVKIAKADLVSALLAAPVGLDELLGELRLDELRVICREHALPVEGVKQVLLARIVAIVSDSDAEGSMNGDPPRR